jgi:hypothetical protein
MTYNDSNPNFYIGEVFKTTETFKEDLTTELKTFSIQVYILHNNNRVFLDNVKPANINIKQIPLVGEHVLVFQSYQANSSYYDKKQQWYYLSTVAVQSIINQNILPVNTVETQFDEIRDTEFKAADISPKQPLKGDVLIEGRWGNSIRLSSTNYQSDSYSHNPTWVGNVATDPIIILSNNTSDRDRTKFSIENLKTDTSAIYLTTTQKLTELSLGHETKSNPLTCYLPNESDFNKSQFVASAERIILKAKTDIVVLDSPKAIILNTIGDIKLGNDGASESMVHGNVLFQILNSILDQLSVPVLCGSSIGSFTETTSLTAARKKLQNLLSSKYFIQKNTF